MAYALSSRHRELFVGCPCTEYSNPVVRVATAEFRVRREREEGGGGVSGIHEC